MKKFLILATALLAGAAVAQTAPVAQPAPAPAVPPATPAPMAHPGPDRVMTRTEVVQMVREHFGQMDTNKDGTVTTSEMDEARDKRFKDFRGRGGRHAMMMGDPNTTFDRLDANKDGSISRDEFAKIDELRIERRGQRRQERGDTPKESREVRRHVMRMHSPGGFGGGMIVMADTNNDGRITQAEAETLALQHFDQMDTNKDGQVTREERRAARPLIIKQMREEKKRGS